MEEEILFKNYFVPFTTTKAITWIIIVGVIIYGNMLFNGFVWDDGFQLAENSFVQSGQYFYYFTHTVGPYYKPLMFFIYTLFFPLFQLNAFFYHSFQLILHIINTIVLFLLFRHFFRKSVISFVLALLFLVHPINEETVAYIADYQDILFVFFGLLALYVTTHQVFKKYSDSLTAVLVFLSTLSKETGVLFAFVIILYTFFFKKVGKVRTILFSFFAGVCYFFIRFILVGPINPSNFTNVVPPNTITSAPLIDRLLTIPKIIFYYFATFVYPGNLAVQYWYVKAINFQDFILPFIIDLCIFVLIIGYGLLLHHKKNTLSKTYWFFFFWFCVGLLLHLQLFPLDFTAADRWFYFPIIGLLGMIGVFISQIKINNEIIKTLCLLFLISLFFIFSIRTMIRNSNWYSDITLFQNDLPTMENVADPQYLYGTAFLAQGDYSNAIIHLKKASELAPRNYQVWHNLGISYLHLNQLEQARYAFLQEISLHKDSSVPYRSLVYIMLIQHKPKEALQEAKKDVKNWPGDPFLWRMQGIAAYQIHNKSLALQDFEKSYSIAPYSITQNYIYEIQQNIPLEMNEL